MTFINLMDALNERALRLQREGSDLIILGEKDTLTPALLSGLSAYKAELLNLVDRNNGDWRSPGFIIAPEMLPLVELSAAEIEKIVDTVPGGAANVQDIYPLAPLQEGILFHHQISTEGDPYLTQDLYGFDSRGRLEEFLQALQAVIDRHDILRTAVQWEGLPEPVQVVWRQAPLIVEEISIDQGAGDVARQLEERFNPRSYRIDLRQAPMMRVYIAQDEPNKRWVMLCLYHHVAVDHTTMEVLQEEILAHLQGRADRLPAPLPFRNFVAQARMGVSQEEHESFFREMLGDVDEPTAPYGLIDVHGDGSDIKEAGRKIDAAAANRLRLTSRALGVSAASLCHLAWALALGRVLGRDDVVFGTVVFGRMHGGEGVDRAPGMMMNTLPIRIRLGAASVEESVRQTHQLLAELMRHEHASLALAQKCSGVAAPRPLFSSLLNYRHSPRDVAPSQEMESAWIGIEQLKGEERTNYPLVLSITDLGDEFTLTTQAAQPADPLRVCDLMRTALERLAEALERAPETPARAIDALPEAERRQLVEEWNATEAGYPAAGNRQESLIHELFEDQVEKNPHAVALVYEEQSLTYGELNLRANRLAWRLLELGVGPEARVAICMERSLEMVVALLATLKAGAAYVPLDPAYPPERLTYMLEDSVPVALLTHDAARAALAGYPHTIPVLNLDRNAAQWSDRSVENLKLVGTGRDGRCPAYIIYTSGSTGLPKGVMIERANVVRLLSATDQWFGFGPADVWTLFHSYAFDFSVWELWGALAYGGRLIVVPQLTTRSPDEFYRLLCRGGVTVLNQTPSAFRQLAPAQRESGEQHSLRYVIFGGEALEVATLKPWYDQNKDSGAQLVNMYGITETTVHVSYYPLHAADVGRVGGSPIGQRIPDLKSYILGAHGQPAPVGVAGEMYIGGAGVARGYLNRPELTAERFLPDPFCQEPGARIYKTGDLGRWLPDAQIEFLGRNDFQIKIRGFRVELGEIEAKLAGHPGVCDAVVLAREDGEGGKRLVAYYTGEKAPVEALRGRLATALPDYMTPATYVHLERLPLTTNGKLDRRALPAPDVRRGEERDGYLAPRTPVEEIVAGIFEEVLKLDPVGRRENFFELGGHSLLATQVISRVRNSFGVEIGVKSIFEAATVEALARRIEEALRAGEKAVAAPLVRVEREGSLPLSFAQQRLWFLDQLVPNNPLYNNPYAVRVEGKLDLEALEKVINEIVRRHEILRTRIEIKDGAPAQVVEAWRPRKLERIDLTGLIPEEREQEARRIAREEAEAGFDLSRGPMLRVKALELGEHDRLLLFTMHHIVSDGWSMGILNREVGALYKAYIAGEPAPLEELEIQYADFAVWQRQWLSGEVLEQELEYWRKHLQGLEDLDLPTDYSRPSAPSYRGARYNFRAGGALAEGLKALGQREGVTLFMTLLGGFNVLMGRYSGQNDIVLGTDIANRNRSEIEGLIGFFVNQLVLRVAVNAGESFRDLLKQVREVCLGAYAHQDVPFEKLVEELQPERDPSRSPLFQAKLILQNAPVEEPELEGLRLSSVGGEFETAGLDLTIAIEDVDHDLVGVVEYSRDLFEEETIERLVRHYTNVLTGIVEDGESPVSSLSLLSDGETEQILVEWNQTVRPYPNDRRVHELFAEQAERAPERIALIGEGQVLSYGELNRQANRLGRYLKRMGVGPEVVVGLCLERSLEVVVALLGALKAGGAYLPLDPESPLERLSYMLEDAGVGVVLTRRELGERMPTFWGRAVLMDEEWERIGEESENEPESDVMPGDLAYVIYTSGSTGDPKGVAVHQQALVARTVALLEAYDLTSADRLLQFVSPSFDAFAEEVFTTLSCGASLVIDRNIVNYSAQDFFDLVERLTITILHIPPAYWRRLIDGLSSSRRQVSGQLRLLITGGESPSAEMLRRWAALAAHQSRFANAYGPTEATITSTVYGARMDSSRISLQTRVPIGRPIANTQIYILDRNLEVAPIGMKGELYIGGVGVARGYLGRVETSAEKFVPHPFNGEVGARLYRTGDVGRYLEDGKIEFLGRADEQVKVRGYRIEPGEIEAVLNEHQSVKQSVVVAIEDERGDRQLVGYIVREREVTGEELRRHLREKVPAYMAPAAYVFLESLPIMPNGKLDRRALPRPDDAGTAREYEAPVGDIETALARIWAGTFHLDRVGRHDNFFALGGHSLMAVDLIERMRSEGLQTDVRTLFIAPTIAELAAGMKKMMEVIL